MSAVKSILKLKRQWHQVQRSGFFSKQVNFWLTKESASHKLTHEKTYVWVGSKNSATNLHDCEA